MRDPFVQVTARQVAGFNFSLIRPLNVDQNSWDTRIANESKSDFK